jgi:hypothetical protein
MPQTGYLYPLGTDDPVGHRSGIWERGVGISAIRMPVVNSAALSMPALQAQNVE